MIDWDNQLLGDIFETFGKPAVYTPADGSPVTITVCEKMQDQIDRFSGSGIQSDSLILHVRKSEVPLPKANDTITFNENNYIIKGEPRHVDDEGLLWDIETYLD